MGIHDGHRQRLRKRFLEDGLENFEEHNVLELLLFYAHSRADTNALAHVLIDTFGSISAVMDAPYDALLQVSGVGEQAATLLKLVPQLASVYNSDKFAMGTCLHSTQEVGQYFVPLFYGKQHEEVHMLSLDDKHKIIRRTKLFEGTVNATPITVKKVVSEAVNANATSVVLAHNHPAGLALPSANDRHVTKRINTALELINIRLLDHIIVAENEFISMAESGEFDR
ncbi:MAG: DNA repair protein RadC [Oscillospiraceae bacterium]|nr:DNA repair protein RadC [Oscillospiraceae bacterium]